MSGRSKHWATGIWLLACTGLAGIIVLELSSPFAPQVTAAPPGAPLPEFASPPDPFDPPPRHLFAEIAARPLFSATRRPFVPERGAAENPQDANIAIELVGTLLTEQGRAALLQPQGENARWVLAGEQIAGWQVVTIERDEVRLRLDEEAKTLELRTDLVQPAPRRDRAERRRDGEGAEPRVEEQAQNKEREPEEATASEDEAVAPATE
jgi:hypothetical protein